MCIDEDRAVALYEYRVFLTSLLSQIQLVLTERECLSQVPRNPHLDSEKDCSETEAVSSDSC
jgi:hypothetical protein